MRPTENGTVPVDATPGRRVFSVNGGMRGGSRGGLIPHPVVEGKPLARRRLGAELRNAAL